MLALSVEAHTKIHQLRRVCACPGIVGSSPPPHTAQRLLCQALTQNLKVFRSPCVMFQTPFHDLSTVSCASRTRVDSTMCFCCDEPDLVHPPGLSTLKVGNPTRHLQPRGPHALLDHAKWPAAVSSRSQNSINSVLGAAFKAPRVGWRYLKCGFSLARRNEQLADHV